MVLTGDQDVRIDFTNSANQIKGLDLNGDGVIANDGKENALNVHPASGYVAVDAYTRLTDGVLNETNLANVFKGDIKYDGTGFKGDGVSTNGNIVLGGLGADTILGGIGNDFLAGGGVASNNTGTDTLSGGRNADFFFTELSLLDKTDGNNLTLDGGVTADDNSAGSTNSPQDNDWLLLQASDDDEPVQVVLEDHLVDGNVNGNMDDEGVLATRAGQKASMKDIENVDASGNTYGFLKGLSATVGGAPVNADNNGIGSSAQLHITTEAGSTANNIIIGGYDNDYIDGGAGNDILMGGNLNMLIDPNLVGLTGNNDGRDELIGGSGADNIVFEADGGIIEGGATQNVDDDPIVDTLWLTSNSLGAVKDAGAAVVPVAASALTTDNTLRFDLAAGKFGGLNNASGYGGADVAAATGNFTADQTNYNAASAGLRVQVQDMENVIATGLGAIDFKAAGANTAADLTFDNQQNFMGYTGNLTLRGTDTANVLYASNGTDVLEGRAGNDKLSGGNGDDDFVFFLQTDTGDGVDVIHRQADLNGDNLWDGYSDTTGVGTYIQDFGQKSAAITANSKLFLTLTDAANPTDLTGFPVNGVAFSLGGVAYTVPLTSGVQSTYAAFTAGLNEALDANPALAALDAVLNADNTITITDPAGMAFVASGYTFVGNVVPPAGTLTWNQSIADPSSTQTLDRLIYRSYEDRLDNELTNDNAITGSKISLGVDAYAQDLVVNFAADGTRLAEDQAYTVVFKNLTTQDKVTVAVNGVTYTLQVGVDLDGNSIAGEDDASTTNQVTIQSNFIVRLNAFINSFMDNDTAAGQVASATNGTDTLTLTQKTYNGEQTVFMTTPVVTIQQLSAGEVATAVVANVSQHEVLLYNFDGRNLDGTGTNLDSSNVLFVGDTMVNQSTLQTANNLTGGTITGKDAVVVDGGANDLANIANNTATNSALASNFSIHGDDFIMGGAGNDTINTGTGDDRVQGSRGTDVLDGGKNYYAVQVLGEAEARVITWNVWEAANPTSAQSLLADPTLAGKTLTNITLIGQTQDGLNVVSGAFDDTLIYAQNDFVTGSTRFTVTLDDFTIAGGVVSLNNGGAGHVTVDLTGDGATADDSTSSFKNFENVRTVSGTGLAVAGVGGGQGNDTLDVSSLSTSTGGIEYDLTNRADAGPGSPVGAGKVAYSANAHASLTRPVEADFESSVMKVDGVESVITGLGDDLLVIDETEAAKDNSFTASLGDDRIEYQNIFDAAPAVDKVAQPTVTIQVNTAVDQDMVLMTAGRVGTTVATDTLNSVEYITIAGNTATSSRENDVLDVTKMTGGAVVSYVDGTVKDLAGVTQVTVEGIAQIENVWADGNDTVIVASSAVMGTNAREDVTDGTPAKDITFSTFLDFDEISATTGKRVAFLDQTTAMITDAVNNGQFTFNLSKTGTAADTDTVDYSMAANSISAIVELDTAQANQYVMVDGDAVYAFHAGDRTADNDRIDVLTSVEKIVASQGESVLDLTSSTKGLEISFGAYAAANYQAAYDRDVYNVQISDLSSSVPLTRSYVEYREAGLIADSTAIPAVVTASWNRIEGSDNAEKVIMNSAHSMDADTFNLRGGANEVKYNELTKSIILNLSVTDFVAATPLTTGLVKGEVTFQDGTGAGVVGPILAGSDTHTITSYTANNGIAAGSLRIAASQDAEDNLVLSGLGSKVFLIAQTGTTDNQITVQVGSGAAQNSVVLTGFELISDANTDDVYDFGSIVNAVAGLDFIDNTADHDTVKVDIGAAAVAFGGVAGTTISLSGINAAAALAPAGFDFDVLDVSGIDTATLTTLTGVTPVAAAEGTAVGVLAAPVGFGASDEVVLGKINNVTSALDFESVVLTQATVAEVGTTFTMNTTTNTLVAGAKSVALTDLSNTLSFGGTVLEQQTDGTLRAATALNATSGVTVTTIGAEAVNFTGGNGNDTLTGSSGNDTLRGGSGNDTLDGGFVAATAPIYTVTLAGAGATSGTVGGGGAVTVAGLTLTTALVPVGAQVAENADADQIGAAFASQSVADWQTALVAAGGLTVPQAATLTSVTYNAVSNDLSFTFNTTAPAALINAALINTAAAAGAGDAVLNTTETDTQVFASQTESADTFVFEATAALNGADILNNVDATDTFNFSAFLGNNNGGQQVVAAGDAGAGFAGVVVAAADDFVVAFNKATLATTDFVSGAALTAGKFSMTDGDNAVFAVSADVDGLVPDATINAWNLYYVSNGAVVGASDLTVTLVGTVNSNAELSAAAVGAML